MTRKLYDQRDWVLGQCLTCGKLNYVEPHGMTAHCSCSPDWTEHRSIPYAARIGYACVHVNTRHAALSNWGLLSPLLK